MGFEARRGAASPVDVLAMAGNCNHSRDRPAPLAESFGQLIAVHYREPDVEQCHLGLEGPAQGQGLNSGRKESGERPFA